MSTLGMIPETLTDFEVFQNNGRLLGIGDATLPNLQSMTNTIKGSGIAGEIDAPVVGHFGSITMTLTWQAVMESIIDLVTPNGLTLDLRGNLQSWDKTKALTVQQAMKIVVQGRAKNFDLGKLEAATAMGTSLEIEVTYIKISVDGKEIIEVDKFNNKYVLNGTDYAADIRKNLGLE